MSTIVSQQPSQQMDVSSWEIPSNLPLADPGFNTPSEIDMLIGAELYHHLLWNGKIHLADRLPLLQNTAFGWMCCGGIQDASQNTLVCGICSEDDQTLDSLLTKFWEMETIQTPRGHLSNAERNCEDHFAQSTTRNSQGRFLVRIPFNAESTLLGESLQMATNRFFSLEQRLMRKPELKRMYVDFMREYEHLGHMQQISRDDLVSPYYVIPHHCVLKLDSSTTKLRVVFDASAKSSSGLSLNEVTHAGPVVQSELSSILLRFRLHRFVFTTDVEKMYRQILIHPGNQRFQVIMWRETPKEPLRMYRLSTVTYGTRSAPYLATKCLQRLAEDNKDILPLGAATLKDDFYVDDGLSGSDSLAQALLMKQQLVQLTSSAGFKLRKWCANHAQLLEGIPPQDKEVDLDFDDQNAHGTIKTLGLMWRPKSDELCIKVTDDFKSTITKRTVTSEMARTYDPLGLIAPVIVTAKIYIQQLWQFQLDWDATILDKQQQQ